MVESKHNQKIKLRNLFYEQYTQNGRKDFNKN